MQTRFIMVTGGVISGVGKGVTTASLGRILKEYGYKTTLIKIDPYVNYDAGTLRPTEHGEVWVTDDGGEIDQDLGTYERFLNENLSKRNNITTGQIYKAVIDRERAGGYLGQTVQFIPHITDEIKNRILQVSNGYDIAIIELGGTVGDYELSGIVYGMIAKGFRDPDLPYFCMHEYKRSVDNQGTPDAQVLAAMLVAREQNKNQKPIYGLYIVGLIWNFIVLNGGEYCISKNYDASDDDIFEIFKMLKAVKVIIYKNLLG